MQKYIHLINEILPKAKQQNRGVNTIWVYKTYEIHILEHYVKNTKTNHIAYYRFIPGDLAKFRQILLQIKGY